MYETNNGTIYRIRKNINFYLNSLQNQSSYHINRSTEASKWKELDRIVLEVLSRLRDCNIPINGPLIKVIALKITLKNDLSEFKASSGWLLESKGTN